MTTKDSEHQSVDLGSVLQNLQGLQALDEWRLGRSYPERTVWSTQVFAVIEWPCTTQSNLGGRQDGQCRSVPGRHGGS